MTRVAPVPAPRRAGIGAARAHGVSLLELIIVVLLIGVMSLLAASAMSGGMKGMQLRSSAKEIASQLRFTRTRAIATGRTQRFTFDPDSHAWVAADMHHGSVPETLHVAFTGAREAQPTRGVGAILFFADGASTGGRVQVSRDAAAWNIDVGWLTGEVKLARAGETP